MKKIILTSVALISAMICADAQSVFPNPIIRNIYTADPSAHVFGDTLYVYPSHDEDNAFSFSMKDYHVFTTTDMKTFSDRGVVFSPFEQTTWAKKAAWAPDCVERNGKYYLSYSNSSLTGHQPEIVYAMSDNPLGPYEYKGVILDPVNSGTNHHSIVEFKGQWYMFYHNADLSISRGEPFTGVRRSVCVDRLTYNPDGTIQKVIPTHAQE